MSALASANERHFTYTYETATLPRGTVELEPWTTIRTWKDHYYLRLDHRLEFEMGLTDRLQAALYWNFSGRAEEQEGVVEESFTWQGVSTEFKYKLLDPVADLLGFALYAEATLGPAELELEGKALFDKRFRDLLVALNLVYEYEQERESSGGYARESILETDLGASYFLTDAIGAGAEFRTHSEIKDGQYEHTAFFLGPAFSYAEEDYWIAVSTLFQLAATKGHDHDAAEADASALELEDHERLNARILLGFHL